MLQHVHHLGTIFTQNDYYPAAVDSQIGLVPGERMSVHDLLLALMLPSADDAAEDLAYNVGHGSVARFVGMMNAEARTLGLAPHPLLDADRARHAGQLLERRRPGQARRLRPHALARSSRGSSPCRSAVLHIGQPRPRTSSTATTWSARYPWIDGVKTGHTLDAGYVLVASGHRNGMTLISAVLGTDSESTPRRQHAGAAGLWLRQLPPATPVRAGEVLARPDGQGPAAGIRVPSCAARGFTRVARPRGPRDRRASSVPRQLTGPLPGAGGASAPPTVLVDGRPVAAIPLRARRGAAGGQRR